MAKKTVKYNGIKIVTYDFKDKLGDRYTKLEVYAFNGSLIFEEIGKTIPHMLSYAFNQIHINIKRYDDYMKPFCRLGGGLFSKAEHKSVGEQCPRCADSILVEFEGHAICENEDGEDGERCGFSTEGLDD